MQLLHQWINSQMGGVNLNDVSKRSQNFRPKKKIVQGLKTARARTRTQQQNKTKHP